MTTIANGGSGMPSGDARRSYLVGSGDPALLSRVADELTQVAADELRVLRVLRSASGISAITIDTTPARASQLRERYGPELIIEEDRPLDQLSPDSPFER